MPNQSNNRSILTRAFPLKKKVLLAEAKNAGTDSSKLINALTDWWLGVPGAELPERSPGVMARVFELFADGGWPTTKRG